MKYQQAQKSRSQSQLAPAPGGSTSRAVPMDVDRSQGGKNAIYSVAASENKRLGSGVTSDAHVHSSLAMEKIWNSESTAYKDLPSTSFSSHGVLRKYATEPVRPSKSTNSNRLHGNKTGPSSRWVSPLMQISSAK